MYLLRMFSFPSSSFDARQKKLFARIPNIYFKRLRWWQSGPGPSSVAIVGDLLNQHQKVPINVTILFKVRRIRKNSNVRRRFTVMMRRLPICEQSIMIAVLGRYLRTWVSACVRLCVWFDSDGIKPDATWRAIRDVLGKCKSDLAMAVREPT